MAAFLDYFPNDGDLDRYVRRLADLVGLRDYKITLSDKPPVDEDASGSCIVTYGRRIASICLREHGTIEELRNTIVHELLHVHLEPIDWNNGNLRTVLGNNNYEMWRGSYVDHLELAIDSMATAWATCLPLPDKLPVEAAEATDGQEAA